VPEYVYSWGNNSKRKTLKGRVCRVLARGAMNSVLIEFTDTGRREIVSHRAIRKRLPESSDYGTLRNRTQEQSQGART